MRGEHHRGRQPPAWPLFAWQPAVADAVAADGGATTQQPLFAWLWLLPVIAGAALWLRSRPWRGRAALVTVGLGVATLVGAVVELVARVAGVAPPLTPTAWLAAFFLLALMLEGRWASPPAGRDVVAVSPEAATRPVATAAPPAATAGEATSLSAAVEQAADAVAVTDLQATVLYVNRAWATMHRMTADEARGHHLSLFHTPEQMESELRPLIDETLTGDSRAVVVGHRRKDGTTFDAETSMAVVRDGAGRPKELVAIARERPPAAETAAETAAERIAPPPVTAPGDDVLGVARSTAHDFNNLLTAVLGNASLALLKLSADSPVRENLEEIERVAQRANDLSRRLQAHIRGGAAADGEPAPVAKPVAVPAAPPSSAREQNGDTILVVDNEKIIRDVATSILEGQGYAVLTADDGAPAVALYRQRREEVGAILLDLTMPHMDGREALREIRRFDPAAPVILMTGHLEQDALDGFANDDLAAFIRKPFRPDELLGTVRRVLGADLG